MFHHFSWQQVSILGEPLVSPFLHSFCQHGLFQYFSNDIQLCNRLTNIFHVSHSLLRHGILCYGRVKSYPQWKWVIQMSTHHPQVVPLSELLEVDWLITRFYGKLKCGYLGLFPVRLEFNFFQFYRYFLFCIFRSYSRNSSCIFMGMKGGTWAVNYCRRLIWSVTNWNLFGEILITYTKCVMQGASSG